MNQRLLFLGIFFAVFIQSAFSQDKELLNKYETSLRALFIKVFNEPTDNERYNANEQAVTLLTEALGTHKSFNWPWSLLKENIYILESKDKKFKIFTWAIIRDNGEYECFGLMQIENEKTNEYDVTALTDKSGSTTSPEEAMLSASSWYGAVYYDLITEKFEEKTYYTLLGWTGNNPIFQRKVIETLGFKSFSTDPIFGQKIFYRDKNRRRIIFEYSKSANMVLMYGRQHYVESKKIRKSKKDPVKIVETDFKQDMIIFDVLEPHIDGLEGLPQYFIPGGETSGYYFDKGRWILKKTIFPRSRKNKKIDNPQSYQKKRPAYEVPQNNE